MQHSICAIVSSKIGKTISCLTDKRRPNALLALRSTPHLGRQLKTAVIITFRKTNATSDAEIIALLIECTHYSCEARY